MEFMQAVHLRGQQTEWYINSCVLLCFGEMMHAMGFTANVNMSVTKSVFLAPQGSRQNDETTHSESSAAVSSPGHHLEHVRTDELLM